MFTMAELGDDRRGKSKCSKLPLAAIHLRCETKAIAVSKEKESKSPSRPMRIPNPCSPCVITVSRLKRGMQRTARFCPTATQGRFLAKRVDQDRKCFGRCGRPDRNSVRPVVKPAAQSEFVNGRFDIFGRTYSALS